MRFPRLRQIASLCSLLGVMVLAFHDAGAGPPPVRKGWELAFFDDFEGRAIDRGRWNVVDPWGAEKNGELQAYVPGNIDWGGGRLRLRADRQKAFYDGKVRHYTSAIVTTARKFSQQYGRFEIRCRVPGGKGLWPAFWLLPDPPSWPPEIDVFEILSKEPNRVYMTHHWPDPANPAASLSQMGEWKGPDFSADWHTYAVEWEAGGLRWYIDEVERHRTVENVPEVPMFLLVNLAIGGDWAGEPDDSTVFPAWFEIDWVRVWKRTGPPR